MSYVALYRKFRPGTFDEVKGQDHVVTTLKNQFAHDRVGHAYLLCGTRGTGKTTVAKLIAKTVNCENPDENGPCGHCESCMAIANGTSLNVIEIDAATHNGVDNIRQINEAVQYSPAQGKYLVYIIDEAHQLSKGAYNALLKTLEEPPEYVIFILATTDDYSLPVTIKSRCQRFDFHRISIDTIADRLEDILGREGESATRDALRYIARAADGSMRDALSILDECVSASLGEELTKDKVLSVIGAVSVDIYIRFLRAVKENAPEKVLDIINETIWDGKDLIKFTDDLAWFVRNVLFLKLSPKIAEDMDMTEENINDLKVLGEEFETDVLTRYLGILQEACSDIRKSSVKRVTLEMAVIKMLRPETDIDLTAILTRLDNLERAVVSLPSGNENSQGVSGGQTPSQSGGAAFSAGLTSDEVEALVDAALDRELSKRISSRTETFDSKQQSDIIEANISKEFPPAESEDILRLSREWNTRIVPQLDNPHKKYAPDLFVEPALSYRADGVASLNLVFDDNDLEDMRYLYYEEPKNRQSLEDALSNILKKKVEISIIHKPGIRGVLNRDSLAINKVNFDVKIREREEEEDG